MFCGSSTGRSPSYAEAARRFGGMLPGRGLALVYGGGGVGLMKVLADAALDAGGSVTGVIPRKFVEKGVGHGRVADLRLVESMHERKRMMFDLADAFVALPGGIGTAEEMLEIMTWSQLGDHAKPCGLLNVDGYYDSLLAFLSGCVDRGFLSASHRDMLLVDGDPGLLLDRLAGYSAPPDVFITRAYG